MGEGLGDAKLDGAKLAAAMAAEKERKKKGATEVCSNAHSFLG